MNWEHPKNGRGQFDPLLKDYKEDAQEFLTQLGKGGLQAAVDYFGGAPDQEQYMPEWPDSERVGWQMYETVTEGTPISPVFATAEELAHWLADNEANAGVASYKAWLATVQAGWAPTMVYSPEKGLEDGVTAMLDTKPPTEPT